MRCGGGRQRRGTAGQEELRGLAHEIGTRPIQRLTLLRGAVLGRLLQPLLRLLRKHSHTQCPVSHCCHGARLVELRVLHLRSGASAHENATYRATWIPKEYDGGDRDGLGLFKWKHDSNTGGLKLGVG